MERAFTFDDMLIIPQKAYDIQDDVREHPDLVTTTDIFGIRVTLPVLSSSMTTVTEREMMDAMRLGGGLGVHHRDCPVERLADIVETCVGGIAISPSMGVDTVTRLYKPNIFFMLDVAHGHTEKCLEFCKNLIANGVSKIISGNVVTPHAVEEYLNIGVNHIRVGMGNGSVCSTRLVTGFGVPQGTALSSIYNRFGDDVTLISDGGVKNTGDIIKAFVLGASYVMSGRLFAGCDECPTRGRYEGMASRNALEARKKSRDVFVEGESVGVESKGPVSGVLNEIRRAILHACHYGGVKHYRDLAERPYNLISENACREGLVKKGDNVSD